MRNPMSVLFLLAGILIATASCGNTETAKNSSVSSNQTAAGAPARPSDLPTYIPFYPGGKVDSDTSQGDYRSLTYTAPVSFNAAFDFYESEFKRTGWEVGSIARVPDPTLAKELGGERINARRKDGSRWVTCYVKIVPQTGNSCSINLQFPK